MARGWSSGPEVLWGHSRYRKGEAWGAREPWRDWGSHCGGPSVIGGPREGRCPSRLTLQVVLHAVAGWSHKSTDLTSSQLRNFPSCTLSPGGSRCPQPWMRGPSLAALPTSPTSPRTHPTALLSLHTLSASTCPRCPASRPLHLPFYLEGFPLYPGPSQVLPALHASPAVPPCQEWSPALNAPQR